MTVLELEALRREVARLERGSSPVAASGVFPTGSRAIDAALGGGLAPGGLAPGGLARAAVHEIFAGSLLDEPSAAGFAIGLALRASGTRPIVWVRQDFVGLEIGEIYPPGLAELGLSPERLILVRARDGPSVLRAGEEAARCPPLGAVIVEPWGNPKALDLAASRRLSLAAARSGVSLFMLRAGGQPAPSAAATRWNVKSAPSTQLEAEAPGHPVFCVNLMRDRAGASGRSWTIEWNRDARAFVDIHRADIDSADLDRERREAGEHTALSGGVVPLSAGGSGDAFGGQRRAG